MSERTLTPICGDCEKGRCWACRGHCCRCHESGHSIRPPTPTGHATPPAEDPAPPVRGRAPGTLDELTIAAGTLEGLLRDSGRLLSVEAEVARLRESLQQAGEGRSTAATRIEEARNELARLIDSGFIEARGAYRLSDALIAAGAALRPAAEEE